VLKSCIGLLCLGKSDCEAVANVRGEEFFAAAMSIGAVPSPETLRKRLDEHAEAFLRLVSEAVIALLENMDVQCTALDTGHVPLDADVTPFEKPQTKKEGGSRTYEGYDDYAPIAAYLGREG
jgi:hypothetical protein